MSALRRILPVLLLSLSASGSLAGWEPVSTPFQPSWGSPVRLLADPARANTWLIGTAGGLLESTDGGASFEARITLTEGLDVSHLCFGTGDPEVLYASISRGATYPVDSRFLRSTDRGLTWWDLGWHTEYMGRLEVAYEMDPVRLVLTNVDSGCGCGSSLLRWGAPKRGWKRSWSGSCNATLVQVADGEALLLQEWDYGAIRRSPDRGETWEELVLPHDPLFGQSQHSYACTAGGPSGEDIYVTAGRRKYYRYGQRMWLFHSTDRGETWRDATGNLRDYCPFPGSQALTCGPTGVLYYAPDTGYPASGSARVLRSTDGGAHWLPASWGLEGLSYSDVPEQHRLVIPWWDPGIAYTLLVGNEGIRLYRYEPSDSPPMIPMAGWLPDRIHGDRGGAVRLLAYVVDPDEDETEVEILYQGMPTGIHLEPQGGGLFELDLDVAPGSLPRGYQAVELRATDTTGLSGPVWPFLHQGYPWIIPGCDPPPWQSQYQFSENGPTLLAGGWGMTQASGWLPGTAELVVLAGGPDGPGAANLVEVMWQGQPTGWHLLKSVREDREESRNLYTGPFAFYPGCHGSQLTLPDDLPAGSYYLELMARDEAGNHSGLWPYLTVE